jgi:acyl carrier protein
MDKNTIIGITNKFLVEEFEVDENLIIPSANVKDTLDLDSLDYVDLVVVIEQNFKFKVKGDDFINIITFDDFYNYIESKVNNQ